ncbi:MAG: sugar phosphate isomerase/epimerase [Bacteroidota bacterium]
MRGPGIFLAQFADDVWPFNAIEPFAQWAADLGYKGVQIPTWDTRLFDLEKAASSKTYCEDYLSILDKNGLELCELASYLQGQVLAMHPAYQKLFQAFYPKGLNARQSMVWATEQLEKTIQASIHFGTTNISVMSGGLAWPYIYPWPQRSAGLVDDAFSELVKRWMPILDKAKNQGVTFGYELHPGSDLYDGATFQRFLEMTNGHAAVGLTYDASHFLLQQLDYIHFIQLFGNRIKAFHVKDAEFLPNGLTGVYGGYLDWKQRAGRFRSLGDGQVDFSRIFTELSLKGFSGWAIMEWECCIKSSEQGAREGAPFIQNHMIQASERSFDDFAKSETDKGLNKDILGI